ncbi:MAG: hypothetical protein FWH49_00415 [Clostridiales bacterium]|nr:hypothetical protein [Clostridiales bacterium]
MNSCDKINLMALLHSKLLIICEERTTTLNSQHSSWLLRGTDLKCVKIFVIHLLILFCIVGCGRITNNNGELTDEEMRGYLDEFDAIYITIIQPCFEYLGERVGDYIEKDRDYEAIIAYFRDNDFSDKIPDLEAIRDKMPPLSGGESDTYSIARRYMSDCTEFLKILVEIGNAYTGKEIQDITPDEKMRIDGLISYKNAIN